MKTISEVVSLMDFDSLLGGVSPNPCTINIDASFDLIIDTSNNFGVFSYIITTLTSSRRYKDHFSNYSIPEHEVQLSAVLKKMAALGYVYEYSLPVAFSPLLGQIIDKTFPKNKLLLEQIALLLESNSSDIIEKRFFLTDDKDNLYLSSSKGNIGGHKKLHIYGRLDCPSAKRYLDKGQYAQQRVFFDSTDTAIKAGYRPCGVCMPEAYKLWLDINRK